MKIGYVCALLAMVLRHLVLTSLGEHLDDGPAYPAVQGRGMLGDQGVSQNTQRHLLQGAPALSPAGQGSAVKYGNYTVRVNYNGELLKNATAASPDECYAQCLQYRSAEGVPCNRFVFCPDTMCTQFNLQPRSKGSCYLEFYTGGWTELDQLQINPDNITNLGSGFANTNMLTNFTNDIDYQLQPPQGNGTYSRGVLYDGVAVAQIFAASHEECRQNCINFNDQLGQYCNIYNYCAQINGCKAGWHPRVTLLVVAVPGFQQCDLKFQPGLDPKDDVPSVLSNQSSDGSGSYLSDAKLEEFASYNFSFGINYNATTMKVISNVSTYIDCYQEMVKYNDEGKFANIYTFCYAGTCDDGESLNISSKTCFLKVQGGTFIDLQSDRSLLPKQFVGGLKDRRRRQLGSGYSYNRTQLEKFAANGNLTWNVAYVSQVVKSGYADNSSACYSSCVAFSRQPGSSAFANVYSFCGAEYNCTVAAANGAFNQTFGQCDCSVQSGLTDATLPMQIAYMPLTSINNTQTSIASGRILGTSSRPNEGNVSYNVEYDGISISSSPQANFSECRRSCGNSQESPPCNVWSYCAADSSVGCTGGLQPGTCRLKFQSNLDFGNPRVLTSRTNMASGVYIAQSTTSASSPGSSSKKNAGAIAGGVVGGVAASTIAVLSIFFGRRAIASRRKKDHVSSQALISAREDKFQHQFSIKDLVPVSALNAQSLSDTALLKLAMHGKQVEDTSLVRQPMPDGKDGLAFEAEDGQYAVPALQNQRSLEDTWRILPEQLQCRLNSEGQLYKLGDGGAGSVYLGVLYGTTSVAIKVVRSPTLSQQKSFIKEIMILKACRHPNVIAFLGASIQPEQTLMVMEALDSDLFSEIGKDVTRRFAWYQKGQHIALDVSRGLAFFHTHSILHLDIKSPNILLGPSGAKIADIGLGRRFQQGEVVNSYQASLAWCAPEQMLGNPCSPASDVFAMGVVMWEICTGERATLRRSYRNVKYPEEAPEVVAHLIRRCMKIEPEGRPSAAEVHDTLLACSNA